jgi:hypothetical protein
MRALAKCFGHSDMERLALLDGGMRRLSLLFIRGGRRKVESAAGTVHGAVSTPLSVACAKLDRAAVVERPL